MKRKLCMAAMCTAFLLTACSNKSVDLLANPADAETETTLASSQDTKVNQTEENTDSKDELAAMENTEATGTDVSAEESAESGLTDLASAEEEMTSVMSDEETVTEQGASANISESGATGDSTITDQLDVMDNQTATAVPTKVPVSTVKPTAVPTKAPASTVKPTAVPTKAPASTVKPTAVPTKAPVSTIKPTAVPTKAPASTVKPTAVPTKAPVATAKPTAVPTQKPADNTGSNENQSSEASIQVKGQTISIGESKSSLVSKLGSPNRTDVTEFNYNYYVYNSSYTKFAMIAVANDKVVGWYTDSNDFSYCGLTTSSTVSNINAVFGTSKSLAKTITVSANGQKITFFMDTLGNGTIDGIYVASSSVTASSTTDAVLKAWEKEVLDLTNSFRARNGLSALSWSDQAASSSRKHSQDMASNGYFSHTSLDGRSPYDRMAAEGISYRAAGENIIGGYGNALYSVNGWVNSSGHRSNMLSSSFTKMGAGYALGGSYGNYCTQNFFS